MAKPSFWEKLLKKSDVPLDLSDTTAFDSLDDMVEEDLPRFNKLRVVVSDEMNESTNGGHINLSYDDDDSLLDRALPSVQNTGDNSEQCDSCFKKKELAKQKKVKKRLTVAAVLYLFFMTGELIGGYVANSLAIVTDALHMLTDLIGIIVSLLALWLSEKPPTKRFTFGFHRLEVLSALISVLLIYILTAFLIYEAVQRTIHKDFEIDGDVMLITAAVGVTVNLIMGFVLNQSGHLHSHSHGPSGDAAQRDRDHGHNRGSLAVRAAFIHALGDLVQSTGVLVAAYVIRFKPEYKIADPICTYVFSVLVLFTTIRIMWDTGIILLEGVPRNLNVNRIREDLMKIEDVHKVEDFNVWCLTAGKTAATVHLQLVPDSSSKWEEVQSKARHLLLNTYGIHQCTVQLQSFKHTVQTVCINCQNSSA
ncbi:zinc transporter 4 [Latimeria chalumnae]|nr:PREDICTED: zinc transporter 4 [Latimeria chalumnae]|eukprot:XP_005998389.1 PREDICTED: zinc transporter 4 [Latimeria chalumnae]